MNKYILLNIISLLLLSITSFGQRQYTVRGKILAADSREPLTGASIMSLANGNTTISDTKGEFVINLKQLPDTLQITFTGFIKQKHVIHSSGKTLTIWLIKDEVELEQILVNTGYQKLKPNEVNGSFTLIDNEMLNEQTGTNILERLNGVTNGLIFNNGKVGGQHEPNEFSIRGVSTINGPVRPLIVLDNFPYEGDIENLNPNDIENVTILKDAAAASIWGARAGNGVIVITTKKARYSKKLQLNFNSNVLISEPEDLFYKKEMPVADYIEVEEILFNKGYFNERLDYITKPPLSPATLIFYKRRQGLISAADSAELIDALKLNDSRKQYKKYFQQPGITQQYSLNASGGSDQLAWLLAGNYNKSINNNSARDEKINVHIENRMKPVKNLEVRLGAYYTNTTKKSGMASFSSVARMDSRYIPYLQFMDADGIQIPLDRFNRLYTDTVGSGRLLSWDYYPLEDYKHSYDHIQLQDIILNAAIDYKIITGLLASIEYKYQKQWSITTNVNDINSFYTRSLINEFTTLPVNPLAAPTYVIPLGDIIRTMNGNQTSKDFRGQVSFNRSWQNHSISAIAGGEVREAVSGPGSSFTTYGYQYDPISQSRINYNTVYQSSITGSWSYIPGSAGLGSYRLNRFVSVYGNSSYTFQGRYSISGSFRKDASNVFGLKTNDKWNPLWSSGLGWDISKETFYHSEVLPHLKLSLSYGYGGNLDISRGALPISAALTNSFTGFPVQRVNGLNNPSLRWEKVKQINIGIHFEMAKNIASGSVEYYVKNGTDLYGDTPYDYTTWGRSQFIVNNVADTKGHGVDVQFTTNNIDRALKWKTTFIFNYNSSKVSRYFSDKSNDIYNAQQEGGMIVPIVGKPLYFVAGYKWGGLNANGDPQGYLNGELSTDYNAINRAITEKGHTSGSIKYFGPSVPVHYGSVINYLNWKGFSFSFNLMYKTGYYFYKTSFSSIELIGTGVGHADYSRRWQKPGDEAITTVPAFVYSDYTQFDNRDVFYLFAEPNILRGDHIRLHYVNTAYQLKSKSSNAGIQIYVNAANLGILWRANKFNLDPDALNGYPVPKQYTVGLRANL